MLNLDDSIAVTQNYVSHTNLAACLDHLATRDPDLISGVPEVREPRKRGQHAAAWRRKKARALRGHDS